MRSIKRHLIRLKRKQTVDINLTIITTVRGAPIVVTVAAVQAAVLMTFVLFGAVIIFANASAAIFAGVADE